MIDPEDIIEPEWLDWYRKTPQERFYESQRLLAHYLAIGGTLEPDVDTESPFWSREDLEGFARSIEESRRRAGVKLVKNAGQ